MPTSSTTTTDRWLRAQDAHLPELHAQEAHT